MSRLVKNKFFLTGFFIGILACAAANILIVGYEGTDHPPFTKFSYGFPFIFYSRIYDKFMTDFANDVPFEILISYPNILLNLLLGIIFSLVLGLIFKFVIDQRKMNIIKIDNR